MPDHFLFTSVDITLRKQKMGHLCLSWCFGQKGKTEDQTLHSAQFIETNSFGQFLVVDGKCVKIFDASGKFVESFTPLTDEEGEVSIDGVDTDRDNSIYALSNL